ncbi:serine hydrolase [uncultured Erythrobacter sp.]|uniref:serine hydrolase domain-containing protein n=1 Tax=uncultured Erythrobacter sp. TaxID=263913 RepID=UPI002620ADCE|nr:serine hydrolase [uncultured Erythrobacter sp.]
MGLKLIAVLVSGLALASCANGPRTAEIPPVQSEMIESLHAQLKDDVVGYAFALGTDAQFVGAGGLARSAADGGPLPFSADTPMVIASASKLISAIATMKLLQDQGLKIEEPIGPYFPSDWRVDPYLQSITFKQLLNQTSGIKDFGNGPMPYDRLKAFFEQSTSPQSNIACKDPIDETQPVRVTPSDLGFCYSNFNAGILVVLLPKLAGFEGEANTAARPKVLAAQYELLVQTKVFAPVGVSDAACAPDGDDHALSYIYGVDAPGKDWGEQYDRCAEGGWYVSVRSLAKVLASIVNKDERILIETRAYSSFGEMREFGLGLDRNWPDLMEKGGVLGDEPGVLATSAMIFAPDSDNPLPAVLFTNSTNAAGRIAHPRHYLQKAYEDAQVVRD